MHHTFIPIIYLPHFCCSFWRQYLLIKLYSHFLEEKKKALLLLSYIPKAIVHLYNVMEAIIHPCQCDSIKHLCSWHSQPFKDYLVAEYLFGCHDPDIMEDFWDHFDSNIELIRVDNYEFDWDKYEQHLPMVLHGSLYQYETSNIPLNMLLNIWDAVLQWYKKGLDVDWMTLHMESSEEVQQPEVSILTDSSMQIDESPIQNESMVMGSEESMEMDPPPPNQLALLRKQLMEEEADDGPQPSKRQTTTPSTSATEPVAWTKPKGFIPSLPSPHRGQNI
ncbi:hypothetical protein BKA82DRAFT_4336659 [Pisolithus tinctorius]|uniref:Uncharacterized protein n=1 Tax=Pisolithus tinctorius Marx 270 TaxID=870435 RepID=A0A0C3PZD7_PISTI|nr:hypothetical protein BKA82DRAFT_5902 [Pisolithus tinctorius]KAI6155526.1 hypothetical protein BKA82DRAFT_4336659 [Pisolithus tinctorius]KIO14774.1 hypothetical protein M404DRAFT_5902 [Pisolithus tinctorius Marx 270]KIO14776.1 hypothetical protein M404DRAFT_5903 [Pisolithus tinctorius Marx 270]